MEYRAVNEIEEVENLCYTHFVIKIVCDVHFHLSNPPTETFGEANIYYSEKHYDYGLKFEISHYLDGTCATVSVHSPASTQYFTR
jgi:hypothetical protein